VKEIVKEQGTVKWFSSSAGLGFIQRQSGEEVFVHESDVQAGGTRSLQEGARVEFELWEGLRGPQAAKVVALDPEGESLRIVVSLRIVAGDFAKLG